MGTISGFLNESNLSIDINKINPNHFTSVFKALGDNKISSTVAKDIILDSYQTGKDPLVTAKDRGLMQVSDSSELEKIVDKVLSDNPNAKSDYKKNPNIVGFLVGQVMKVSGGSANPQLVKQILEKKLK